MATTHSDILRLSSFQEDGLRATIIMGAIVDGLDADHGSRTMLDALAQMPAIGQPHPWRPLCVVRERRVVPLSTDQCEIQIIYKTPEANGGSIPTNEWILEDDVGVSATQTQIDSRGEPIIVKKKSNNRNAGVIDGVNRFTGTITKLLPQRVLRASIVMDKRPPSKFRKAVGLVNEREWQGDRKGCWLCTGVRSVTQDSGRTYAVTVSFLHNPDTHAADVIYVDERGRFAEIPKTEIDTIKKLGYSSGQSPALKGLTRVTPYGTTDFNALFNLPRELN